MRVRSVWSDMAICPAHRLTVSPVPGRDVERTEWGAQQPKFVNSIRLSNARFAHGA
jgi:hypothetical protein